MEFNQLQYFRTIARLENITKASAELYVTQPSLSRAISRLEDEIGVPLFYRNKGKICLNENGKIFLDTVEKLFSDLNATIDTLRTNAGIEFGQVSLATSVHSILLNFIKSLFEKNPQLIVRHTMCDSKQLLQLVLDREADLAITMDDIPDSRLSCVPLVDNEIFLIVGSESHLLFKDEITLSDLKDECFICNELGFNKELTDALCKKAGFVPKKIFISNEHSTVGEMLESQYGVSFLPTKSIDEWWNRDERIKLLPIDGGAHRQTLKLYYNNNHAPSAVTLAVIDGLKEYFSDRGIS